MQNLKATFILCLVLGSTLVARAQHFENEGLESSPAHRSSEWYQEYLKPDANVYRVHSLLSSDENSTDAVSSLEQREVIKWIVENWSKVDAQGVVQKPEIIVSDLIQFLRHQRGSKGDVPQNGAVWRNIGPFTWDNNTPIATGSQGIGVVRCMDRNRDDDKVIVVGTVSAGLWRSGDGGFNWRHVSPDLLVRFVNDVAVAPSDGSIFYAATDMGLARSLDTGKTFEMTSWDGTLQYPRGRRVDYVAVDPKDPFTIVIASENGLHRSTDGGTSWSAVETTPGNYWDLEWNETRSDVVYALHRGTQWISFLRSTDGGVTFDMAGEGLPVETEGGRLVRGRIATTPAAVNNVWVLFGGRQDTVNGVWGLYESRNNGGSFEHVCCGEVDGPELADEESNPNLFDYNITGNGLGQLTWDMAFAVSDTDPDVMVAAGIFPYKSTDGGRTWNSYSAIHYDIQDAFFNNGATWVSNDGGVFEESSDLTFTDRSHGICAVEVWGFGQSHLTNSMAIGAYHLPVFIRDDELYDPNGFTGGWYPWSGADAMNADVHPDDERWFYAKPWTSRRGERTKDKSVAPRSKPLGIDLGYIPFTNVEFHPRRTYTILAADHATKSVSITHDNASTWTPLKTFKNWVSRVRFSESDPNVMIAVGDEQLWRTTDGGEVWDEVTPPFDLSKGHSIADVIIDDEDASKMWLAYKGQQSDAKVVVSVDGGDSWALRQDGLPAFNIFCLEKQRNATDVVYVGTDLGVYVFDPSEQRWAQHGVGLPAASVRFLHVDDNDGLLRAGTSRGIWEAPLAFSSRPRASITFDTDTVICSRTPVRFASRSVLVNNIDASQYWMFEGGDPETSTESIVNVRYYTPGTYDVYHVVSDGNTSDTMLLEDAITVVESQCSGIADEPGGALSLTADADYVALPVDPATWNQFTFTAWIKRHGTQPDYSCVFSTHSFEDGQPIGALHFFEDTQELGYHWPNGQWWWRSGLVVPEDEWVHVALIVNGKGATVMLNGIARTDVRELPGIDLSNSDIVLGNYKLWASRNANIDIDEVRIYDRALSVDEVRLGMHHPVSDEVQQPVFLYQFDETKGLSVFDKLSEKTGRLERGVTRIASAIPFGRGVSTLRDSVEKGWVDFPGTAIEIDVNETTANTHMVARIDAPPPSIERNDEQVLGPSWWILHEFELEKTSVGNLRVDLAQFIGKTDAPTREFMVRSRQQGSEDPEGWSEEFQLDGFEPAYISSEHTLRTWLSDGATMDMQLFASVRGGPVSVQEQEHNNVRVYPNPARTVVTLTGLNEVSGTVRIVDMQGVVVKQLEINTPVNMFSLNISDLPTGPYTLTISASLSAAFRFCSAFRLPLSVFR